MKITKKIAAAIAVAFAIVPHLFAVVELDANLYATPFNRIDAEAHDALYEKIPVGFSIGGNFYFGEIKPFSIGLNVALGYDNFFNVDYGSEHDIDHGFNGSVALGPVFRFGATESRHSFHISPGVQFDFLRMKSESVDDTCDLFFTLEFGVHIDAGYSLWLVQKEKFALALNFGVDYSIGAGRVCKTWVNKKAEEFGDVDWYDLNSAQHLKVYAGVKFRIGD
ncbi:MAG: hypothetical protein K2N58_08915 [Treponemataceae bacterium]|nr:hypothetical protein [Treponemataceae bacterium]